MSYDMTITVAYIDKLQKSNADDLAFYPLRTLEDALLSGHIISAVENDEPAGYLWFGAVRPQHDVVIYQACIDYDARRRHLGFSMVADLIRIATAGHSTGIRLRCASSSESNDFWKAIGFHCTNVLTGGVKRRRELNCWRTDLVPHLFQLPTVEPSTSPIYLDACNAAKRAGEAMPNRFSRSHYRRIVR